MYLTGGTSLGEHFQEPHHLPNTGDVSENCAQVTWLQLAAQLLRHHRRGEVCRHASSAIVYNHLLAAQKPDGRVALLLHAAGRQEALRRGHELLHVERAAGHRPD